MSTLSNIKPTQVLFLASFILLLLFSKVRSSNVIYFNFNEFVQNQKDLIFQGDTTVSNEGVLRLNKVDQNGIPVAWSIGKALYIAPVHIWNNERVASFRTSFSFFMEAPNVRLVSDGLTFFLARPDFSPGDLGGGLGLFNESIRYDSSYQIVAVEFDTHGAPNNPWDPSYQHIGIDVNNIVSENVTRWDARYGGEVADVQIIYEAFTKTLTATLTYPSDQKRYSVSGEVDLKKILPEWVVVGFTGTLASTWRETHDVLNWEFASTLDDINIVALKNKAHDVA